MGREQHQLTAGLTQPSSRRAFVAAATESLTLALTLALTAAPRPCSHEPFTRAHNLTLTHKSIEPTLLLPQVALLRVATSSNPSTYANLSM